ETGSGEAQIVDVRPFVEFGKGRIPGSVALDPSTLLKDGRIKGADELAGALGMVDKGRPVVVCSDEITRSAIAWLALELLGYDASIYPWEDWVSHQPGSAADQKEPTSDTRYLRLGRI
ncbi:MAG: rhodanese-like domain-containing protein, partial [Methanothrix sp.]|nr:rhodanese-like domain-containing protein [Methanothrix sp.]